MAVFITGASSGIGEACARAFAAAGHGLILAARREEKLQELAKELRASHPVEVDLLRLDVTRRKEIEDWVAGHPDKARSVSVLINNAGLARGRDPIHLGDPGDWDEMIDTNVKGLLYVTRALLPAMIERAARGELAHVVNLGSVAGHWTYADGNVYCATKYAVRALTESMRYDLHGSRVRVTEISPGMVKTEFSDVRFKGDRDRSDAVYAGMDHLTAGDIAESILWCVQRPARVNIQELVIYPTDQAGVSTLKRRG